MRNIEIHLQTIPSELDLSIDAMNLLMDIKEAESKVNLDLHFYTSFEEFTEKKLYQSPKADKEFFEDCENQTQSERNKSLELKDTRTSIDSIDSNSEETKESLNTDPAYKDTNESNDSTSFISNSKTQIEVPGFRIKLPRRKRNHQITVDKVVIGIYNEDRDVYDDYDLERLDKVKFRSYMFCSAIRVSPSSIQNSEGGVCDALRKFYYDYNQVPHLGGFEFETEDSLRIHLLLHLLGLKVLYKRYLWVRLGKVYYRNVYVGDLAKTRYSLEHYLHSVCNWDDNIPTEEFISEIDPMYKDIIDSVIILSALTYCIDDKDGRDYTIRTLITQPYGSSRHVSLASLNTVLQKAEKERSNLHHRFFNDVKQQQVIQRTNVLIDLDAVNMNRARLKGEEYHPSKEYIQGMICKYHKIIQYAAENRCDAVAWNYLLMYYSKFLVDNCLQEQALAFMPSWTKMCRRHLDLSESQNFFCYHMGYTAALDLYRLDEFARYARKYVDLCLRNEDYFRWDIFMNVALPLAEYYMRKGKFDKALDIIQQSMNIYDMHKETFNENAPLINTRIHGIYADILLNKSRFEEAIQEYLKVLEACYIYEDADNWDLSTTYSNMANCYTQLGQFEKALPYQLKAVEIVRKLYGDTHKSLYILYNNLDTTYSNLGNLDEAQHYAKLTQKIQDRYNFDDMTDYCTKV